MESTGHTLFFDRGVHVCAAAGVAGPAEGKGPLGEAFDVVLTDDRLGEQTFERGEKRMLMEAARLCLGKGKLDPENCGCCGNCKTERRMQDVTVLIGRNPVEPEL